MSKTDKILEYVGQIERAANLSASLAAEARSLADSAAKKAEQAATEAAKIQSMLVLLAQVAQGQEPAESPPRRGS